MQTVLVVDDMPIFREPIAASLRLAGYQTLLAPNSSEAMQVLQAQKPDLILMDVAGDGITFLQSLRKDTDHAWTPVILLTSTEDPAVLEMAHRLGVRQVLLKAHFSLMDLTDRVEKVLAADPQPPIVDPAALNAAKAASPVAAS